jgi:ribosomal-protein-alanine N-acetyltransferase
VSPQELVDPEVGYHAVMAVDRLIGFRSFGPDGQVPGREYDDCALDTGGGLRPDLTGQGLGRMVIALSC